MANMMISWKNYSKEVINEMQSIQFQELFTDATIVCGEKFFHVHRILLASCSEYFKEIFKKTPCKHPFIIINEYDADLVAALLKYMYNGEASVPEELLPSLIKAARYLKIKGLSSLEENLHRGSRLQSNNHYDDSLLNNLEIASENQLAVKSNIKYGKKGFRRKSSTEEIIPSDKNGISNFELSELFQVGVKLQNINEEIEVVEIEQEERVEDQNIDISSSCNSTNNLTFSDDGILSSLWLQSEENNVDALTSRHKRLKNTTGDYAPYVNDSRRNLEERNKRMRTPWNSQEEEVAFHYFKDFIKRKKIPGKSECNRCINRNFSVLGKRNWLQLKYKIKNKIGSK